MLYHRRHTPSASTVEKPVRGLVHTRWVLGVCVVCGHELAYEGNHRRTCPSCGAQLRFFTLYRGLEAQG